LLALTNRFSNILFHLLFCYCSESGGDELDEFSIDIVSFESAGAANGSELQVVFRNSTLIKKAGRIVGTAG